MARRSKLASLVVVAALGAAHPSESRAADYGDGYTFGLGLFVGEPTGISMEFLFGGGHGLQANVAFELVDRDRFLFIVDYLWHPTIITSASAFDLGWHVGVGGFVGFWWEGHRYDCYDADPGPGADIRCDDTEVEFGAHFPVGLDMFFKSVPIEIFIELAPGLRIFPGVDFAIFGGLGARYFF